MDGSHVLTESYQLAVKDDRRAVGSLLERQEASGTRSCGSPPIYLLSSPPMGAVVSISFAAAPFFLCRLNNLKRSGVGQILRVKPIEFLDANKFVADYHRHHKPTQGHRFSIAAYDDDRLCGVAIIGRPVGRLAGHPLEVAEVTRLCTDGTRNACSLLYAAAARACKAIGYTRLQTYILSTEPGTSLKAAGWICDGEAGGGQWSDATRTKQMDMFGNRDRRTDQPTEKKLRWSRNL